MSRHRLFLVLSLLVVLGHSAAGRADLIMEPVINRVPGSGPAPNGFPFYSPNFLLNGVAYFTADEPGEIVTYAAGDPRDPLLDQIFILNNTAYDLTGLTLRIVGTATDTQDPATIVRGPVDAVWGDVNGDGRIGVSDIFSRITVSPDGKEIRFEDGLIPVGGRCTDVHLARSTNPPQLAGIDSSFTGFVRVPEPSTAALLLAGAALLAGWRKRTGR